MLYDGVDTQSPRQLYNTKEAIEISWYCPTCWVRHSKVPKHVRQHKGIFAQIVRWLKKNCICQGGIHHPLYKWYAIYCCFIAGSYLFSHSNKQHLERKGHIVNTLPPPGPNIKLLAA